MADDDRSREEEVPEEEEEIDTTVRPVSELPFSPVNVNADGLTRATNPSRMPSSLPSKSANPC